MTSEQFLAGIIAFIVANISAVFAFGRWGVNRAIKYTHLERDVKELQDFRVEQAAWNDRALKDMKGLSMKAERLASHPKP